MKHLVIDNKLLAITTFVSVLLFELSAFFIDSGMAWINQIKNVLYLYLLYLVAQESRGRYNPLPWNVKCYTFVVVCLVGIQTALGIASGVFNLLLQLFIFLMFTKYSSLRFARYLLRSIVIIAFISSIPLVYYYFLYGYYARNIIIFDKSFQTLLFGVSYVYLFYLLTKDETERKGFILTSLIYLFLCNVYILQSKTSIFAFFSTIILWSIFHPQRLRHVLMSYWKYLILIVIAVVLLPIKLEMPDAMKQAVNKLAGHEVYKMNVILREDTYDIRSDVRKKMWNVLDESPFLGGGFGNMEKTLKSTGHGLTQGESQLVDFALEGGYTYVFAFAILMVPFLWRAFRSVRRFNTQNQYEFVCLSLFCFIILCTGNEMFGVITWMYIAALNNLLNCKENVVI